ncbi:MULTISPECIES: hypothetical protein [Metabacillus]|uniref:Uncharacterized protein n=2 Tax=Metabacillus TaxID=2675233 RepID=A0A179T161_9BACI|nr:MULTISPECIES: hypothetical protein [Metabacillus]OAS87836.1 hypothetical protein A6K24_19080 [Metabacillus litoralis]QNF27338.1 hypothetical protein HUW50_07305 [Metabacillus sp. KUDC1714]
MNTIQLSIEELIFSFYSEGLFEQGMSIKEAYFPTLQESELKLMLEVASRSLLAKDMIKEVHNQYKLKDEFASYIHTLNYAESTVKASKHQSDLNGEESISFHYKNEEVYLHKVLYDNQVHSISKLPDEEIISVISSFFNFHTLEKQSEVLFQLKSEEFEELLEDVSQSHSLSESIAQKWGSKKGQSNSILEFLNDISTRNGKMDSLLSLKYDSDNNPELMDLYFIIPGKNECWLATRDNNLDLNIQRANETSIKNLLLTNKVLSA